MSALQRGNPYHTESERKAYLQGYTDALWDFAWQKDGEYRVGSGFFTHKHAHAEAVKRLSGAQPDSTEPTLTAGQGPMMHSSDEKC
jgi:hypothetical protein